MMFHVEIENKFLFRQRILNFKFYNSIQLSYKTALNFGLFIQVFVTLQLKLHFGFRRVREH